jgi:hypothetical protein
LTLDSVQTFAEQNATVTGIMGRLILATSSHAGGRLISYATVNITLQGVTTVTVQVNLDGHLERNLSEDYEISATTPDGKALERIQLPLGSTDDRASFSVLVPDDASPGELISVVVTDKSSGEAVGTGQVRLSQNPVSIEVKVFVECECPYRVVVPLLMALLPGLLILGFALSIHFQRRKEEKKKS